MDTDHPDGIYKLKEFAELKKVPVSTVRTWITNGLPTIRLDWYIRISLSDFEKWVQECKEVKGRKVKNSEVVAVNKELIFGPPSGRYGIKKIII